MANIVTLKRINYIP